MKNFVILSLLMLSFSNICFGWDDRIDMSDFEAGQETLRATGQYVAPMSTLDPDRGMPTNTLDVPVPAMTNDEIDRITTHNENCAIREIVQGSNI